MIATKNLSYTIQGKTLLKNITADFHPGQMNLILGANGAGKSTLLKLLAGQLTATEGNIYYDNKEINTYTHLELARRRSVLSQHLNVAFPLTVQEIVMMGRYPHYKIKPGVKDEQAAEESMRFFGVLDVAKRDYQSLSGGEKQRVQFARVAVQIWYKEEYNRCLFLDEPLTYLDLYYQFELMEKLKHLLHDPGFMIVGIVHDLNLALRFADEVILLKDGEIHAAGNSENALTKETIKHCYNLDAEIKKINDTKILVY